MNPHARLTIQVNPFKSFRLSFHKLKLFNKDCVGFRGNALEKKLPQTACKIGVT